MDKYMQEENLVWEKLFERQSQLIESRVCRQFISGMQKLKLDPKARPEIHQVSKLLRGLTGWSLVNAENEYLNGRDWFKHLANKNFPVTDYIRTMEELDFTPLPDLFHESCKNDVWHDLGIFKRITIRKGHQMR
jgi:phenylalanine-4-hydroxylase